MKKFCFICVSLGIVLMAVFAFRVGSPFLFAQEDSPEEIAQKHGITFPITELGNCTSPQECKAYCDDPAHFDACIEFAKKKGLMKHEEAENAKKFVAGGQKGPGDCTSARGCRVYCAEPTHRDECVTWAERNGFIKREDAERVRKIPKGEEGPGGCMARGDCETYCEDPAHAEECLRFAEKHGLIPKEELERAKRGLIVLKEGGPGGCRDEASCRAYCEDPAHQEECSEFGRKHGLIRPEEDEFIRHVREKGGPGGCRSEKECWEYCNVADRMEECLRFAEEQGFLQGEERDHARKMMQTMRERGGPGGCNSPEDCRVYCEDPAHHTDCFKWAHEHGVIPPEDLERMKQEARRMFEEMPDEVRVCLVQAVGEEVIAKLKSGEVPPGPEFFGKVKVCFEKFGFQGHGPSFFPTEEEAPEFVACLKGVLSSRELEELRAAGGRSPGPEISERIHECAVSFGPGIGPKPGRPPVGGFMHDAPPEVIECAKGAIGEDKFRELQEGKMQPERAIFDRMRKCFEEFQKNFAPLSPVSSELPGEVEACVKKILGEELFQKLHKKEIVPDPSIFERTRICFEHMPSRPPMRPESFPMTSPGARPPAFQDNFFACLVETVGKEVAEKMRQGIPSSPDVKEKARRCFEMLGTVPPGFSPPPHTSPPPFPTDGTACPREYAPVCGAEGKTYPNRCFAEKAGAKLAHFGPCEGQTPPPLPSPYFTPQPRVGPGGCTTFEGCKQYCSEPAHFEECSKYPEFAPPPPQSVLQRFLQAAIRLLTR